MTATSVSCIIAVYNGQKYLAQAIESLLEQTLRANEIIVVDDGSTDDSAAIVQRYGDQVRYLYKDHAGVSPARNHGIDVSTGQLISFLDADDLWHADKLQGQVQQFNAQNDLDICECCTDYFWSPELTPQQLKDDTRHADPFWKTCASGHISTWLIKRHWFDIVGGFNEAMSFAEDVDWYTRARDAGAVITALPDVLTYRRLHPNNVSAGSREAQIDGLTSAFKKHLERRRNQKDV